MQRRSEVLTQVQRDNRPPDETAGHRRKSRGAEGKDDARDAIGVPEDPAPAGSRDRGHFRTVEFLLDYLLGPEPASPRRAVRGRADEGRRRLQACCQPGHGRRRHGADRDPGGFPRLQRQQRSAVRSHIPNLGAGVGREHAAPRQRGANRGRAGGRRRGRRADLTRGRQRLGEARPLARLRGGAASDGLDDPRSRTLGIGPEVPRDLTWHLLGGLPGWSRSCRSARPRPSRWTSIRS